MQYCECNLHARYTPVPARCIAIRLVNPIRQIQPSGGSLREWNSIFQSQHFSLACPFSHYLHISADLNGLFELNTGSQSSSPQILVRPHRGEFQDDRRLGIDLMVDDIKFKTNNTAGVLGKMTTSLRDFVTDFTDIVTVIDRRHIKIDTPPGRVVPPWR